MEKHYAPQSPGSPTSKDDKQTPDKEPHQRLQSRNNSSTNTSTTMPSVPQRDHVHNTPSQNQCAQGSTGQKAPTPTPELATNNSTSNMGMDQNSPHGDKSTQMPSQEIHTTTFSQSTQFPSQQLNPTTTNEDHTGEQSSANTLKTASLKSSLRLGDHQGTFTS